ncbi:MAG: hypothetical protein JW727_04760 [Candidatus Aenigmarchaeota archaeon]|nr:hypothetical protein [Candidatus Aenigmarchaeota archaeon]
MSVVGDNDALFRMLPEMATYQKPFLGKLVAVPPLGQDEVFNFTLTKGKGSGIWIGLMSFLDNKGYKQVKVDETLDISPVDQGYYNLTIRQKEDLEGKIKQGLGSVAQAVADFELVSHDFRKYAGFLKMLETGDEHSLRATFMDEVDISTGNNAIKTMIARWPTMVSDFLKLGDKPETRGLVDVDKISKEIGVSRAEAVILSTKQRLYLNWKEMFGGEVRNRCHRILALKNSREMTIKEYREWLRPVVTRHKMLKESIGERGGALGMAFGTFNSPAQAISSNDFEVWGWQSMMGMYARTGSMEVSRSDGFGIDPFDDFVRDNIVLAEKVKIGGKTYGIGLKGLHPWITKEWANSTAEELKKSDSFKKTDLYYAFLRLKYNRTIIRLPDGSECDDVTFTPKMYFFSQNTLMVLLIRLKAIQKEFDDYIDQLIGYSNAEGKASDKELEAIVKKWKEQENKEGAAGKASAAREKLKNYLNFSPVKNGWKKVSDVFGFPFVMYRHGPYEHNFADRIATPYLATEGSDFYGVLVKKLMSDAGVGE